MRTDRAIFEWQAPSPVLTDEPPEPGTFAAAEWEADVFLAQLPKPPAKTLGVSADTFSNPIKANRITTGMLLLLSIKRTRTYAVVLPRRRTVRMVRWVRPLTAERFDLPGVTPVPPLPPMEVATTKLSPGSWLNVVAPNWREIEPSSFDAIEHRRQHSWVTLPAEYHSTSLPGDATGWRRNNIRFEPKIEGLGAGFISIYTRGNFRADSGMTLHRVTYTLNHEGVARRTVSVEHAEGMWQLSNGSTEVEAYHSTCIEAEAGLTTLRGLAFQDEREYL
jgi:hypothetical protein